MEYFYLYYYPVRIVVLLTLAAICYIRRDSMFQAGFMIFVLILAVLGSCVDWFSLKIMGDIMFLSITSFYFCSISVYVLGAYAINALLPGWLNKSLWGLLLIPTVIVLAIISISFFCGVEFDSYATYAECLSHIGEYQIWIRLVMVAILWIQYWTEINIPRLVIHHFRAPIWYNVYSSFFFIYVFTFGLSLLRFSDAMALLQSLYVTIFVVTVCILELTTHIMDPKRIKVTSHISQDYQEFVDSIDKDDMDYLEDMTDIFYKIEKVVMSKELFKRQNLTIYDIARETKIPSSIINSALKAASYASFNHFIAKCRVVALKDLLVQNNGRNILDLYIQVGFGNRATASKYFKLFTGLTPTEWIKKEKHFLYH